MKFNPEIHTKQYLLQNHGLLHILSSESADFAKSELAADMEILSTQLGSTTQFYVAHNLAQHRPEWLESQASTEPDVLSLREFQGFSVAHYLAKHQPGWANHPQAKNLDILKLYANDGSTVALLSATHNAQWITNLSTSDMDIFCLPIYIDDEPDESDDLIDTLAERIVRDNPTAIHTAVLNCIDFLNLRSCLGSLIAHHVAQGHKTWFEQPIAKEMHVLKLSSSTGWSTAHVLALTQPEWLKTKEAKMDEVLRIADTDGYAVAHVIAYQQKNYCIREVWDPQYLRLSLNDFDRSGFAVAHELAKSSVQWINEAAEAFSKEYLTLTFTEKDKKSNTFRTVALVELITEISTPEVAERMLNVGAALKYSGPRLVTTAEIRVISDYGHSLIESVIEPLMRVKLAAVLYSTVVNLHKSASETIFFADADKSLWLLEISKCENTLRTEAAAINSLYERLPELTDMNCEPSDHALLKICNEREFDTIKEPVSIDEHHQSPTINVY